MRRLLAITLLALVPACTGEVRPLGLGEPIRVEGATLRRGALPGSPDATTGPRVTAVETSGGIWQQGQLGRTVTGRVSDDAVAIGVRLDALGTGWWTLPVGAPRLAQPLSMTRFHAAKDRWFFAETPGRGLRELWLESVR